VDMAALVTREDSLAGTGLLGPEAQAAASPGAP
jgi:hypothetical protein